MLAALLCFVQNGYCDCVAVIIVLFREFSVTSIRLISASKGKVVAANIFGKIKTVSQMIAIIAILLMQLVLELPSVDFAFPSGLSDTLGIVFFAVGEALIWISTIFAAISGIIYIIENRKFISEM